MKIILSQELEIKGEKVKEIELDLLSLTGDDCIRAQEELLTEGVTSMLWEFDKRYLAALAARALKVPTEDIRALPIIDFTLITMNISNFLMGA